MLRLMGYAGFMAPKEANGQCQQAVLKALEFDETLPPVHCMMAVLHAGEFDWKHAEGEFLRAMELEPKAA